MDFPQCSFIVLSCADYVSLGPTPCCYCMIPDSTPDQENVHTLEEDMGQEEKKVFWKLSAKENYRIH